jgi:protein O-mannosyl-transferase
MSTAMSKRPKGNRPPQPDSRKSSPAPAKPAAQTTATIAMWQSSIRWHWIALLLLCFLSYANTLGHQYALDDGIVITENMFTEKGLAGLKGIFTKDTFYGFFKEEGKDNLVEGGRYRPFTLAMFALEIQLFGKNPFWGHLFNILWYGLSVLVLYWVLTSLLSMRLPRDHSTWVSFMVSIIFAVHPIHTEVVANIKGRDEIMAFLGSMAALCLAWKAWKEDKPQFEVLAVMCFAVGLFSKENAITFLAIIPLTLYFFGNASLGTMIRRTAPFLVIALVFIGIRATIISSGDGTPSQELLNNPYLKLVGNRYVAFTPAEKLATIFYTLGKYIQLLLVPHPLTHDYYPQHISLKTFAHPGVIFSLLLYLGMAYMAVRSLFNKSLVGFGLIFYLATLSIVSNLVVTVGVHMSERFVFMPSAGFILTLVLGLYYWLGGEKQVNLASNLLIIVGVVCLGYTFKTLLRNPAWKDNLTLFSTDVVTSANSAKVQSALGGQALVEATTIYKDDSLKRTELLALSEKHLIESVRIHPGYKGGFFLLGTNYLNQKRYAESVKNLEEALRLSPGDKEAAENLVMARGFLAEEQGKSGNLSSLEAAYQQNPNNTEAKNNLARAYRTFGKTQGEGGNVAAAMDFLQRAVALNPGDYETLRLLGVANSALGRFQEGFAYFEKALNMQPDNATALFEMSMAYGALGNKAKEKEMMDAALKINPNVVAEYGKKK